MGLVAERSLPSSLWKFQSQLRCRMASCLLGRLRFYCIGCGKLPVPVRLAAQRTIMQFARFTDRGTTCRTRYGDELLWSESFVLHKLQVQ